MNTSQSTNWEIYPEKMKAVKSSPTSHPRDDPNSEAPRALLHPSRLTAGKPRAGSHCGGKPSSTALPKTKAPKKHRGFPNSYATPPKMQIPSKTFKQCHQAVTRLDLLHTKERGGKTAEDVARSTGSTAASCDGCSALSNKWKASVHSLHPLSHKWHSQKSC